MGLDFHYHGALPKQRMQLDFELLLHIQKQSSHLAAFYFTPLAATVQLLVYFYLKALSFYKEGALCSQGIIWEKKNP